MLTVTKTQETPIRFDPLRRLAERVLGCPDLAEEAVQEAMIALWKAEVDPLDPQAWLARAVVNRSLHHLRTVARRRKHECSAARSCVLQSNPTRRLEDEELRSRLKSAIADLPREFRVPLELYEFEGLDYQQIADRARLPVGTVRSRIHRARRRLRKLLVSAA